MGSAAEGERKGTKTAPMVVKIQGREVKVASDSHQPGSEARCSRGARILESAIEHTMQIKRRDAEQK